MRLTLDTVGRIAWPQDRLGRTVYPEGFEELAKKLGKPVHPPGRDVRCIVSVGMLTEGWDCSTVTHIVGLRPFMSQLLCEQVVGRGLRRPATRWATTAGYGRRSPRSSACRSRSLIFDLAADLTRDYAAQPGCQAPAQVLFPQLVTIVERFLRKNVRPLPPADILDVGLSPYYGWVVEALTGAIKPDAAGGEEPELPRYEARRGPGTTAEVDFWTSRDVREVVRSHLNYVVADTAKWEQSAAYVVDTHPLVEAFVKNAGLGFAIPYIHNGQAHDYVPDFIVRLKSEPPVHLILETKGFDPLEEVKTAAAKRWVAAVNADGSHGRWRYAVAKRIVDIAGILTTNRD